MRTPISSILIGLIFVAGCGSADAQSDLQRLAADAVNPILEELSIQDGTFSVSDRKSAAIIQMVLDRAVNEIRTQLPSDHPLTKGSKVIENADDPLAAKVLGHMSPIMFSIVEIDAPQGKRGTYDYLIVLCVYDKQSQLELQRTLKLPPACIRRGIAGYSFSWYHPPEEAIGPSDYLRIEGPVDFHKKMSEVLLDSELDGAAETLSSDEYESSISTRKRIVVDSNLGKYSTSITYTITRPEPPEGHNWFLDYSVDILLSRTSTSSTQEVIIGKLNKQPARMFISQHPTHDDRFVDEVRAAAAELDVGDVTENDCFEPYQEIRRDRYQALKKMLSNRFGRGRVVLEYQRRYNKSK